MTAHEIDYRHRIAMQAAIQAQVCLGISSTINLPRETTPETVAKVYREAWEAGCKEITVYREGSRDGILLTKQEAANRQHGMAAKISAEVNRMAGRIPDGNGERRAVPVPQPSLALLPAGGPAAMEQGTSHSMDNGNGFCPRCGGHTLSTENGCSKCPCGFQER